MYTDFFLAPGTRTSLWARLIPGLRAALAGRRNPAVPASRVVDFPLAGAWSRLLRRLAPQRFSELNHFVHVQGRVIRHNPPAAAVLYAFVPCCAAETLAWARSAGLKVVGDQIMTPLAQYCRIMAEHAQRWPGWWPDETRSHSEQAIAVEERLWPLCDRLVCGSSFVREGLVGQGVDEHRIDVVPHPLDPAGHPRFEWVDRSARTGPVTVGFLGQLGLRKGVPYLLEAARRLPAEEYRFVLVGPCQALAPMLAPYRDRIEWAGPAARSDVPKVLSGFDLFVLPSLCEGSANAINEAMATGLPVVCTAACGSRVSEGEQGFIVPGGDAEALADRIALLGGDRDRRLAMGRSAHALVAGYSMADYADHLRRVIESA